MPERNVRSVAFTIFFCTNRCKTVLHTMETSGKHVPYGKKGLYSEATKGCFAVFSRMSDSVVRRARPSGGAQERGPAAVSRLGPGLCGRRDLPATRAPDLPTGPQEEPSTPIEIVYEDQRTNDWTCVFERVSSTIPTSLAPAKDLADYGNVYVLATGTSFYRQCTPNDSVDVAFVHRHALADRRALRHPRRPALLPARRTRA